MIFHHGSLDEERDLIYGGGSFHCLKHGEEIKCSHQRNGGERCEISMAHIKEAVDQWWKGIL